VKFLASQSRFCKDKARKKKDTTREKTGARAWSKRARGKWYEPVLRLEVNGENFSRTQSQSELQNNPGRFVLWNFTKAVQNFPRNFARNFKTGNQQFVRNFKIGTRISQQCGSHLKYW
jgi:hypothetical protein